MTKMDDDFTEAMFALQDASNELCDGLFQGKLDSICERVGEYFHDHPQNNPAELMVQLDAIKDSFGEEPDQKVLYEAQSAYLMEKLSIDRAMASCMLQVFSSFEITARLFGHIAASHFDPSLAKDFTYRGIQRELEKCCEYLVSELGGVGTQQAAQMVRNFKAGVNDVCREYMSERGIAPAAMSR